MNARNVLIMEVSNQIMIKLIKKKIEEQPRKWHSTLNEALWAYRMAYHGSIKTSPYELVYGYLGAGEVLDELLPPIGDRRRYHKYQLLGRGTSSTSLSSLMDGARRS